MTSPSTWVRPKSTRTKRLEQGDLVMAFDVGQRHLAECVLKVDTTKRPPFDIIEWCMCDLGSTKTSECVEKLVTRCITRDTWGKRACRFVIIEQQDRKNPTMVAMSHAIQSVLLMRSAELGNSTEVLFASAAHKFSVFKNMGSVLLVVDEKGTHGQRKGIRKKNAVRIASAVLDSMRPATDTFIDLLNRTKANQKDDLADAFVYASSFIYKNEPIVKTSKRMKKEEKYKQTTLKL